MKTIEIKQDGKVLGVRYLKPLGKIITNRYDIHIDGKYYDIVDNPPFIYLDENGNDVAQDQQIWFVKIKQWGTTPPLDELWKVWEGKANHVQLEKEKEHYKVFVTKEAADKFVSENRPFEFITEDDVMINEGDQVFKVNADLMWATEPLSRQRDYSCYTCFSSRQAANEYVKKNKAVLSLDMIEKMIMYEEYEWSNPTVQEIFRSITELVNKQFKPQ